MRTKLITTLGVCAFAFAAIVLSITSSTQVSEIDPEAPLSIKGPRLPLTFIQNVGQIKGDVQYHTVSSVQHVFFNKTGHTVRFLGGKGDPSHVVRVDLLGSNSRRLESRGHAEGIVGYFKGQPSEWSTNIPARSVIGYAEPWSGVDLAYKGNNGHLEAVYTVSPGADPKQIKLRYQGQDSLGIDGEGNLVYATSVGQAKVSRPVAWQEIGGNRIPVETAFQMISADIVGFRVAEYDRTQALVIDPTLTYASYLGGSADDRGADVAVDSSGNLYLTGETSSTESTFPDTTGPDTSYNGGDKDAYIAKFNSTGTSLTYCGFIGGSGNDLGYGVAVDASGNAYVVGDTTSGTGFPATTGPDTSYNGGSYDAFVAKINSSGTALSYAGFIGGSDQDNAVGISVDGSGNAYVSGTTGSSEGTFPVNTGPDVTFNGGGTSPRDAFIAKVVSNGASLVYAGYVGGSGDDFGRRVVVDSSGFAYLAGYTNSDENSFPIAVGPDLTYNLNQDAFIAKVDSDGDSLIYAGYIGGTAIDDSVDIAIDQAGAAYVTGRTSSNSGFPVKIGPDLTHNSAGDFDAYIAKINPSGSGFVYAGFIGGDETEYPGGVTVDRVGSAYISGQSNSSTASFPTVVGPDLTHNGGDWDAFVSKVLPNGRYLVYSGYIGGSSSDIGRGITVDTSMAAYISGNTDSSQSTFPDGDGFGAVGGYDQTHNGSGDAWVAKVSALAAPTSFDYDADGKSDVSVYRPTPTPSYWYLERSTAGSFNTQFGNSTDIVAPGDYDGDGKTDIAVFRPSTGYWYRYYMGSGSNDNEQYGQNGDIPAPGDFDADGIDDIAVYRGSNSTDWYIKRSTDGGTTNADFGVSGDQPVVGDYDGDGTADTAVYRPSDDTWYIQRSTKGYFSLQWGSNSDLIAPADYDGDGFTDIAVFRPSNGTWYRYFMRTGTNDSVSYGTSGDIPTPGDYDGDAIDDVAVFRPSTGYWWLNRSRDGSTSVSFGTNGDIPTESAFVRCLTGC